MSKRAAIIPLSGIDRIAILLGRGKPLAQVKGDAGYILNGGFYDMATGKPVGHLKVDGQVLAKETWTSWGFGWNDGVDIAMESLPYDAVKNYLSGVPLLTPWDGVKDPLSYPAGVGGARPRSALALTGDKLILYCTDEPTTPEALREELYRMGAETAVMLDSGGSSQCDFRGETIRSGRRVHNYIAVWLKKEENGAPGKAEGFVGERTNTGISELSPSGGSGGYGGCEDVKKVVLDPGHGAETAGKRSPDGSYLEHEFNLDMAFRVKAHLERHGVAVTLTRTTEKDVSISDRAAVSNAIDPDLFVSLHSNAAGSGASWMNARGYGIYTSVAGENVGRNIAAKAILARAREAGIHLWGDGLFHDADDGKKDIGVLWKTAAPAALIEHLFHDNKEDVALLKSGEYRALLAKVDAQGILDYLGIPWIEEAEKGQETGREEAACPHCGGRLKIEKG